MEERDGEIPLVRRVSGRLDSGALRAAPLGRLQQVKRTVTWTLSFTFPGWALVSLSGNGAVFGKPSPAGLPCGENRMSRSKPRTMVALNESRHSCSG